MNLKTILAIYRKEMQAYFYSATAYVVMTIFLLILGYFFTVTLFINGGEATMRPAFSYIPIIFLFFIPAITMRSVAEEKKSGTFELLVTMPINDSEIVFGKFLSAISLVSISIGLTLVYVLTLASMGNIDAGEIFSSYLGLILMGSAYVSLGILASTLSENQIVAFIIGFLFVFFFFILDKILMFLPAGLSSIMEYISIDYHFNNISRGVIDTRDLIYYCSIVFLSLFISKSVLESRKIV